MTILVLKTVIFKSIYEYRCLVLPHHAIKVKVTFFHAQCADLSLTFPNLRGKFNFGVLVESEKKKLKKKKKFVFFFFLEIFKKFFKTIYKKKTRN